MSVGRLFVNSPMVKGEVYLFLWNVAEVENPLPEKISPAYGTESSIEWRYQFA